MSTSEQELRGQIAGMREALRSARASARTGRIVGILGVVVGLCVVACYVVAFINLGKSVAQPEKFMPLLQARAKQFDAPNTLKKVFNDTYPTYVEEGRNLLKEIDLPEVARRELDAARAEVQPLVEQELRRVAPKLEEMLLTQKEQTLANLQKLIEKKLGDHLTTTVRRQEQRLGRDLNLNQESLAQMVTNLQDASIGALQKVVEKRVGNVKGELTEIAKDVGQLPALPESPRGAILDEMALVLGALIREALPEYENVDLDAAAIGKATAQPEGEAAWTAQAAEDRRKAQEEIAKREAGNE